jgi:hypothetical protein
MIHVKYADGFEKLNKDDTHFSHENEKSTLCELKTTFRFSKGLFVMFFIYACTILPMCAVMVIDINQNMSAYVHLYPWLFFRLCSAVTPIVYPMFHSSIRRGIFKMFKRFYWPNILEDLKY